MTGARQAAAAAATVAAVIYCCALCRAAEDAGAFVLPQRSGTSIDLPGPHVISSSFSRIAAPATSVGVARNREAALGSTWRAAVGVAFVCAAVAALRSRSSIQMFSIKSKKAKRPMKPQHGQNSIKNRALQKTINGSQQDAQLGYRISGAPGHPGSPHAWTEKIRWAIRFKRRIHTRRKIEGTCARPRLAVFRSKEHMHCNVVNDTIGSGVTLCTSTTKQKHNVEVIREMQGAEKGKQKTWSEAAAEVVGKDIAKKCLDAGVTMVVFDRGGFPYEGRVQALAEAARSAGLQF